MHTYVYECVFVCTWMRLCLSVCLCLSFFVQLASLTSKQKNLYYYGPQLQRPYKYIWSSRLSWKFPPGNTLLINRHRAIVNIYQKAIVDIKRAESIWRKISICFSTLCNHSGNLQEIFIYFLWLYLILKSTFVKYALITSCFDTNQSIITIP